MQDREEKPWSQRCPVWTDMAANALRVELKLLTLLLKESQRISCVLRAVNNVVLTTLKQNCSAFVSVYTGTNVSQRTLSHTLMCTTQTTPKPQSEQSPDPGLPYKELLHSSLNYF